MKNILYFIAGAAIGSGVTYAITRKMFNSKIDELAADMKADYEKKLDDLTIMDDMIHLAEGYKTEEHSDEPEAPAEKPKKSKAPKKVEKEHIDYTAFSNVPEVPANVAESMVNKEPVGTKTDPKGKKIYCIAPEEFIELNGYEKVTLTYFEEDQVFMDEFEEPELNGMKMIGKANLKKVGEYPDGTLYVRNDTEGKDFEIIFESGSYADYVEGK